MGLGTGRNPSQGTVISNGIGKDNLGNVYIVGFGNAPNGVTFGNTSLSIKGMFLSKYNKSGKLIWAKQQPMCIPKALHTDAAGNCYVTGMYRDTLRVGNTTLTCQGFSDIFVMKFDSTGTITWVRKAGGPGRLPQPPPPINNEDEGTTIATDAAGNVYVGGFFFAQFNTTATFDSVLLPVPPNAPVYHQFGFLAKYNAAGQIRWVQKIDFKGHRPEVNISVSKMGDCYLTGNFGDTLFFSSNLKLGSKGGLDMYFARYNTNGNLLWAKSFGGTGSDFNQKIAVNKQGESYLSGTFNSPNLPIGANTLTGSANRGTVYVAKCDSTGNILWAAQTTGSGSIGDSDMAIDTAGSVLIASSFSGTVTIGQQSITASSPTRSLAVSKWSSLGMPLWAVTGQGEGGSFKIVAGAAPDECYVSGDFIKGLSFGSHSVSSLNDGVFVAKLSSKVTGIKENSGHELSVYPNPAQRVLFLNFPEAKEAIQIQLTNVHGRTVFIRKLQAATEIKLDLPELAKGIYFLTAQSGKQVFRRKVVIQ